MKPTYSSTQVFFELMRAGLWKQEARLSPLVMVNFNEVFQMAQEQSMLGLITAGLDHVSDVKVPYEVRLMFVGSVSEVEQRNVEMNQFVAELAGKMQSEGINAVLVKGQGVAQCYEKPLWRSSGDIDLLLDDENYEKAKIFLIPMAKSVDPERGKYLGISINGWTVELHGWLYSGLSSKMDKIIDEAQKDTFKNNRTRLWRNGDIDVLLPSPDNDVIFVFTHFLKHFYKGGLGLRHICDWCRLLWTYRSELDLRLLKQRIKQMGLMTEWRVFAAFAVDYLGMPAEALPLYSSSRRWSHKAKRICSFVISVGDLGRNRDMSYYETKPYVTRKAILMRMRVADLISHAMIFPMDSLRFFPKMMFNGVRSAIKGY